MVWGNFLRFPSRPDHAVEQDGGFNLGRAVDDALREAVSDQEAARIYLAAAEDAEPRVPLAEAVLDWLPAHEPKIAWRVAPAARRRYPLAS